MSTIKTIFSDGMREFCETSWQGKLTAVIGVVAAIAIIVGLIFHYAQHPAHVAMQAAQAKGAVIETTMTAASAESAIKAVDAQTQDVLDTSTIHTENDHAIQTLPAASIAGIADADADAWKRGLCRYAETDADPECARLR